MTNNQQSNNCLIDYLRFSIPSSDVEQVASSILGFYYTEFSNIRKGSPYPTYDEKISFANIDLHISHSHNNILVDMAGQACRQYEEQMSTVTGWHWQKFIAHILTFDANITRIDLALDIFDDTTPTVKKLQDYIRRGQLSSKSTRFTEINSGRILDGKITGRTIYIGAHPQILRIYDKKQERRDNADEVLSIESWIRWELEISDKKALYVAKQIGMGQPLNQIIRGILSAHYAFKTQPKGKKDFKNKARWNNMKWWDQFIASVPQMPLRTFKEKPTLKQKKHWLETSTAKSLAMIHASFEQAYGKDFANIYINELINLGKSKINDHDDTLIQERVIELTQDENY